MLRPSTLAILAVLPAAAVAPDHPREVGVATALEKIRPGDALPAGEAIDLAAARGECESAQIAIRPARPLAALAATVALDGPSPLVAAPGRVEPQRPLRRHDQDPAPDGASLRGEKLSPRDPPSRGSSQSSTTITPALYRVETVELAKASGPEGAPGPWPDALVPVRDAFFGEERRAFPVAAPAGRTLAIWVEVCVPEAARAGTYRGAVRLQDGRRRVASVPLSVRVWPFALPRSPEHVVTMGLPTRLGTKVLGTPDDPTLARALAAAALRHRVSPHGLSYDPPSGRCTAERCELDWSAYDAELAPVLDGTLVPGVRGGFAVALPTARDFKAPDADLVALLRAWKAHFEARGWADRLWLYTLDEPKPADMPELARRARAAHAAGLRVFATTPPSAALEGLVDAFAPVMNFFEGHAPGAYAAVKPVRLGAEPGRPFWYTSCMSHGCDDLPAAGAVRQRMVQEFRGWPGYEIDRSGASVRALGWLGWRHRVAGELYYTMLESWQRPDPWKEVRAFAGNGDGTLLYPGLPERLGGAHPFPVESIRLKLVRDAVEDRELLGLAERSGLAALASRLADDLAPSLRGFAREPRPWIDAHRRLGDALAASFAR